MAKSKIATTKTKAKPSKDHCPSPVLSPHDIARATPWKKRINAVGDAPKFLDQDGEVTSPETLPQYLAECEALGTAAPNLQALFKNQLLNLAGVPTAAQLNAALEFMHGLKPQNEIETMIISQVFAAHKMAMEFAARGIKHENPDLADRNVNRFNRCTRVFSEHIETLRRIRGQSNQQKILVQHVHVGEGGKAVVGNVQGGMVSEKIDRSTP